MDKGIIISIDLGGTNLRIGLLKPSYEIISKEILSTRAFKKRKELISALVKATEKTLLNNKIRKKNILGAGLGLPGPIDVKHGVVHFFPNIRGWKNVKLKKILENKLRLPVFLDNDANLMCLAESRLGAAKGYNNVVCLTLGTGVGGGIIIDGKLYRGSSFAAGEVGHMPINEKGERCTCGGWGCLESYVGNKRIIKKARKTFGQKISLEELSLRSKKKDRKAMGFWQEVGEHLGNGLVGVVNFLNPDAIVIGGGLAGAGSILFEKVSSHIKKRAMSVQGEHVKILKAQLGNDAGLIGAAILVRMCLHQK